jgi:hypothetical protein
MSQDFRIALYEPNGPLVAWTQRLDFVSVGAMHRYLERLGFITEVHPSTRTIDRFAAECQMVGALITPLGRVALHQLRPIPATISPHAVPLAIPSPKPAESKLGQFFKRWLRKPRRET